jgi:hypothetical protein
LRDHWTIESHINKSRINDPDRGSLFLGVADRDIDEFVVYPEDEDSSASEAGNILSGNVALAPAFPLPAVELISASIPPVAPSPISAFEKSPVTAQNSATNSGYPDHAFGFSVR